ncbi:MAG: 1,4-alpha-glucan branching protein GlgB [Ruminococcus sp.]|nr:1,4-alpha-glucan branching protein GlgB [Ruminococcus sp.]
MDMHEFYMGNVFDAYNFFGAHKENGCAVFRTFAPQARAVSVIGEWNGWVEIPMQKNGQVWELWCPEAQYDMMYKYIIYGCDGQRREHCDPYGFGMELRPGFASVIRDLDAYTFGDEEWMSTRTKNYDSPMNIYELHLGSWMKDPDSENGWYSYTGIADKLIEYCKRFHFTHIELMPISEHPADISWGYQNTGFFAPTSRYGTAAQLMELIDRCHQNGIGVILDFVPVHFAIDDYGLIRYDGSELYEYNASNVTVSEWGTCNFNFSRREVICFMQSAANYWLDKYHADGLRMDAVSRAIYWLGDEHRGVNPTSLEFLKHMNAGLRQRYPTAMLIAEDSTAYPKITAPVEYGGLGFDYKWDLGFMHDTLNYFRTPPAERPAHYHKLTFSMMYFYNELYMLTFSHDENVHGKATVVQKMWGDYDQKFPQARAFYMYMFTHPGKKLNFMGSEFAHFREWDETKELDWFLLKYPLHDSFREYFGRLGELYTSRPCLYSGDYNSESFHWLIVSAERDCVYAYERECGDDRIACVFNLSDKEKEIPVPMGESCVLREILNSDWDIYSGSTPKSSEPAEYETSGFARIAKLTVPPFTGRMFEILPPAEKEASEEETAPAQTYDTVLEEGGRNIIIIENDDE